MLGSICKLTHKNTLSRLLRLLVITSLGFCGQAFAGWQAVESATVEQENRVYVRGQGYYTDNSIHSGDEPLEGEAYRVVITQSTHAVTNASGTNEQGHPYFEVTDLSEIIRVWFANGRGRFDYSAELQQETSGGMPELSEPPVYNNATVHDPSVVQDENGTFYVFGSHLAAARSEDLMSWELIATDVTDDNPLFDTYATEVAEGIAWSGGTIGSWAADVIRLADGKYYFYYNHCASPDTGLCDASRSYLGVAVSDDVEGPYQDLGLILRSGHVGDENPGIDGNPYNGNIHPNAIDPDVFFDKEGRLWMVYGSYSGGIWIMEMDPQSGFPLEGQGYGTKLMGGYYSAIEGPYMLYSPESDYYYLFTSFGGYEQNDGYNMRIARSRNPDGPFVDAQGLDMIGASGGWGSIEPYGVKLMGGHLFKARPGDPGTDHGYMAPGHNSAYYDQQSGRHFVIFHTRFPEGGEGHQIRVHELFVNADGWLVASPHRYAPIEGENVVSENDALGVYQFINHEKDINREAKVSSYLALEAEGQIGGDFSGSYVLGLDNELVLNIDGLGSFDGVLLWQWNDNIQQLVPSFSAIDTDGQSVWGSRLPPADTQETLSNIGSSLTLPEASISDLELPTLGSRGASITWQSDNTDVISTDGRVTRPNTGEPDATVTLSATVELDGQLLTKEFTVTVEARKPFNRIARYSFEQDLSDNAGYQADGSVTGTTPDTTDGQIDYASGQFGDALWLNGSSGVRLPDGLIDNNAYTVSLWLNPTQLTQFTPAFFGAATPENWLSLVPWSWDGNTMLWSGSQVWYDATTGEQIPADSWSHVAFAVDNGSIRVYIDGEQKFIGNNFSDLFSDQSAVFTLGVNYWDIPFNGLIDELSLYEGALSAEEIRALDIDRLPTDQLLQSAVSLLDLGELGSVRQDLELPQTGAYASVIEWQSSNPAVLSASGEVNRPASHEQDAIVTLTATLTLDGFQASREFQVTVRSLAPPAPVAEFNFDVNDLSEAGGNFAPGQSTGPRLNQAGGNLSFAPGVTGSALQLDGNSGVKLPDNLIIGSQYSFALWLNPSQLTQFTPAFFAAASPDSWVSLVPNGVPAVNGDTMLWSGTNWYDAGMGTQIPVGSWSHIAVVANNGALQIFLNGQQVFSGNGFPDVFASPGNEFGLGVNFWDTPYQGLLDEVRFYAEAITADEVQQLYLSSQP
jgi:arabinan endo-1,5-alpha-L-arabinosidase